MARPTQLNPVRLLAAVVLSMALLVPLGSPAQAAEGPGPTKASKAYGKAAEKATNAQRVKRDRVRLKGDACLAKWAAKHAKRLAKNNEGIWHQDLTPILRDCNLTRVGENVAAGFGSGKSVVKQGWMKSPGHRKNILNKKYRRSETVARKSRSGTWYAVQLFGTR